MSVKIIVVLVAILDSFLATYVMNLPTTWWTTLLAAWLVIGFVGCVLYAITN